ncbi:tetratricopeptide (TPR) repeat protein [Paraburkholderia sp. GAS333]|uniref:tetratricopeptide repeat-containing glycosyltransferase family protein n=1 Tax=Paraburkholderia sp. GAS333 TaxID=3156279 RepID=UPI003D22977B
MPAHPRDPSDNSSTSTLHEQAIAAYQAGQHDTVQALAGQILTLDSQHTGAMHLNGLLALAADQPQLAQDWLDRAIQIGPEPILYNTLYAIHLKLGDHVGAIGSLRKGLALQPDFVALHYNLALTLQHLDCPEDAAISYRRTLELDPDHSAAHNNLGRVFADLGDTQKAEHHYRRALELAPANLVARNNLAMVLLATGRYQEAWPYFEDRWVSFRHADGSPARVPFQAPLPRWSGDTRSTISEAGTTRRPNERLLVLDEQGYGDSLQFVRYLPIALERFALVGYVCPPPLRRLYEESLCSRWPGLVLLDETPSGPGNWDRYCPLMSLPMAFDTQLATIPANTPYLYADSARAAAWRTRLDALPDSNLPRVGVVWAGGHSGIAVDRRRSLAAAQIAPLLALNQIHWISLQKTDDPAKLADPASHARLTDWTADLADFADTAALIANLDLVVSVDTSVAHLAAAMGKPVWLLNRFAGCWRWLRGRDDSPWYPSLRLFTQTQRGNWDEVLTRVGASLQQRFPQQNPRPF